MSDRALVMVRLSRDMRDTMARRRAAMSGRSNSQRGASSAAGYGLLPCARALVRFRLSADLSVVEASEA